MIRRFSPLKHSRDTDHSQARWCKTIPSTAQSIHRRGEDQHRTRKFQQIPSSFPVTLNTGMFPWQIICSWSPSTHIHSLGKTTQDNVRTKKTKISLCTAKAMHCSHKHHSSSNHRHHHCSSNHRHHHCYQGPRVLPTGVQRRYSRGAHGWYRGGTRCFSRGTPVGFTPWSRPVRKLGVLR